MVLWQPTLHLCSADISVQLLGEKCLFLNLMNFGAPISLIKKSSNLKLLATICLHFLIIVHLQKFWLDTFILSKYSVFHQKSNFKICDLEVLKIVKIVLWIRHFVHKEGIFFQYTKIYIDCQSSSTWEIFSEFENGSSCSLPKHLRL